jgi:trimeric autotransporter adhesin
MQKTPMLRRFRARSLTPALSLAILSMLATGCAGNSQVRVVNAVSDAPVNFDLVINGTALFSDVGFESVSPSSGYQPISSGSDSIGFFQTGTTIPVVSDTSVHLAGSKQYTIIATGYYGDTAGADAPGLVLLADDNTLPKAGDTEVRIVHASPSAPGSVDVYVVPTGTDVSSATPTISGLMYEQASNYESLSAATYAYVLYTVIVTPSGSKTPFINQGYTLSAGQIRTLVLVDASGSKTASPTPLALLDLN